VGQTEAQANQGKLPELANSQHANPNFYSQARWWIKKSTADERTRVLFPRNWIVAFRDITSPVVLRTAISAILPHFCTTETCRCVFFEEEPHADSAIVFTSAFNSFVFDFVCRTKFSGNHLSTFVVKQLPLPTRASLKQSLIPLLLSQDWLKTRVLELTYTAWDLEAFAQDCGWSGPPFRWDEERRFLLRCELDAAFFHLYLGPETEWRQQPEALTKAFPTPRAAVSYILDTFPIVKRKDEAKFNGDYRTKRVILEIYDALTESMQTGKPYQTRLNPAPASLAVAHPWDWQAKPLELPAVLRVPLPENWHYVVNVMLELLWQAGGSLPWRVLRTATDLLSDRKRLAQLGELHVVQVALDWLALNGDSFDATHRWDQLSGFCHQGKMRVVRKNDELVVELLSADGHVYFPHVRFDARLALTVARTQPVTKPTAAEAKEDLRVAELIPA
jgi:hypothetical protein